MQRRQAMCVLTYHSSAFVQTLLQWKSIKYYKFWVRVCSLRYPPCNAHAPYCHLWPVRLYYTFPLYLINGMIFLKKILNITHVFWFSLQLMSETFLSLRRIVRDMTTNVKCPLFVPEFNKTWFYWKIFEKYSNIKFHENLSSESRVVSCRRTDMTKLIVVFPNCANAPKMKRWN